MSGGITDSVPEKTEAPARKAFYEETFGLVQGGNLVETLKALEGVPASAQVVKIAFPNTFSIDPAFSSDYMVVTVRWPA